MFECNPSFHLPAKIYEFNESLWRSHETDNLLGRTDTAKPSCNLNISDVELVDPFKARRPSSPTTTAMLESLDDSNAQSGEGMVTFLTLPPEIRLRIYNLLLVSRFDREENPVLAVEGSDQKMVLVDMTHKTQRKTIEPAIVYTCKQIYNEASRLLYSQNVFRVEDPEEMLHFIARIRLRDLKLIRSLYIWVPANANISLWRCLLRILGKEAKGLRVVQVAWDSVNHSSGENVRMDHGKGLGDNLSFANALSSVSGLEKLVISGFYSTHWPYFFGKTMAVQVQERCGHSLELYDGDSEAFQRRKREENEKQVRLFKSYQEGIENLMP